MTTNDLSDKQPRVLRFVQDYFLRNGFTPTIREIKGDLNISSTSVVTYALVALERDGHIELLGGSRSRGIRLKHATTVTFVNVGSRIMEEYLRHHTKADLVYFAAQQITYDVAEPTASETPVASVSGRV